MEFNSQLQKIKFNQNIRKTGNTEIKKKDKVSYQIHLYKRYFNPIGITTVNLIEIIS